MHECEVRENCRNFLQDRCWYCKDYALYWPENIHILSPRQVREREERRLRRKMQKQTEASKRGKRAKKKGYAGEYEIVQILQRYGIEAERVPLSGALGGKYYSGDVLIRDLGKRAEVKRRKSGLKTLYTWLRQNSEARYVFFREDREDWLVVMPLEEFVDLVRGGTA